MRRSTPASAFQAALLASAMAVPVAGAQPSEPAAAQSGTADAIRVLFDQATFWRNQYQPQKVEEALSRVLALDPQNANALALQAQDAADAGNTEVAQKTLRQLRAVRPDDPRIATVEQVLRAGPPDMAGVEEARRLARDNKPSQAVEVFRRAVHGSSPPPQLATEYYQMLAGTDGGWQPARAGLVAAIRSNPDDLRSQLAYAELLTYRIETRDEGLNRLGKLMAYPAIARQADTSYRQALLWLPSSPDSVPRYDVYLSRHPGDSEIATRENEAKNDRNSVRQAGYAALQANTLREAEAEFNKALAVNADDGDALLGLALTRFKQKRAAEGRALIQRVIELNPAREADLRTLLDQPPVQTAARGGGFDPRAAARIRADYQRVNALAQRGDFVAAEALLRRLAGPRMNAGNYLQLASIQAGAGQNDAAAASYRKALQLQPRNPQALAGLGRILTSAGRYAEAETVFSQASTRSNTAELARLRGEAYRMQAGATADMDQRASLLRRAVEADPANPWTRLELARMLLNGGRPADGQAVMEAVTSGRATSQQLLAGIYYANEAKNLQQAGALAARLPERDRDPDIRSIQVRAEIEAALRDAHALGSPQAVRQRLFTFAAMPDRDGARVQAFGQDLVRRGDKPGARELVRIALAARPPTPAQRIAYAAVLVAADYPADAKIVAARLTGIPLNPLQTTNLNSVRDSIAVSASDALNGRGNTGAALQELTPRLAASPEDPALNMALGRIYQARRDPDRALALNEALLARYPDNLDVRRSAISAAMAAGEMRRADTLAAETKTLFPDDPQAWVIAADVARARGQSGRALSDLRTARGLRQEQLRSGSQSSENARVQPSPLAAATERASWTRYAQYSPANTMSDAPGMQPIESLGARTASEPVTREYVQYVAPQPSIPSPMQTDGGLSEPPGVAVRAPSARGGQPGVTAEDVPSNPAPFYNRFATSPSPTPDEPDGTPSILNPRPGIILRQPADPVLRDIDRSIAQISATMAPQLNGSLSVRGRSGASGLEQLFELAAPLEASYSPAGFGRLKVQVTPTILMSGSVSGQNLQRFGTNPLVPQATLGRLPRQDAAGSGLDVGYAYDFAAADIGVTPLGFQESNVVGGIELAPRITDQLTVRVLADRRAVTDSLLSYAGASDPRTGIRWGGVTRNRAHVQVEGGLGTTNLYAGAGYDLLFGHQVQRNSEVDAGAGFSTPVYADDTKQVRVGLDLVYFGFSKNLAGFTVGQGGYYSPQQFLAALFPINFRHQATPDLVYNVGASLGFQTFREKGASFFAGQSGLQQALAGQVTAANPVPLQTSGARQSGVAGGAHGDIDYRVNENLHIGAQAGFDRSGPFTEGTGLVYARYMFNDAPGSTQ